MADDLRGLHCPGCGYDLTGLLEHRCPECGLPFVSIEVRVAQLKWQQDHEMLGRGARSLLWVSAVMLIALEGVSAFWHGSNGEISPVAVFALSYVLAPLLIGGPPLLIAISFTTMIWASTIGARRVVWQTTFAALIATTVMYRWWTFILV